MILVREGVKKYFFYGSMLQNMNRTNTITNYPTVEGTSFVDHYYREPDSVSFKVISSEVSKSQVKAVLPADDGAERDEWLSVQAVRDLVDGWFKNATRLTITSRSEPLSPDSKDSPGSSYTFANQVLKSYSWSDEDLALFTPTLTFTEARVQTLRTATIVTPEEYYQAAYGSNVNVGGTTPIQSGPNLISGLAGAAAGAWLGSKALAFIPGGAAIGGILGGALGFLGGLGVL